jgi:hypothetical protein
MGAIRKKGFEVAPNLVAYLSRARDGRWVAWLERGDVPLERGPRQPRLFEGDSAYQAQCQAVRWLREQTAALAHERLM